MRLLFHWFSSNFRKTISQIKNSAWEIISIPKQVKKKKKENRGKLLLVYQKIVLSCLTRSEQCHFQKTHIIEQKKQCKA